MHAVRAYRKRKRVQNILKKLEKRTDWKKENCMKYADKIDKIVCVCSHDLLKFLTNMCVPGFYMGTCKCTDKSLSEALIFVSTNPQWGFSVTRFDYTGA